MEFFRDAYSVRLLGHTGRYLWADEDKKSVAQKKGRDSYGVIWRVELVPDRNAIRLKSVYDLYLMATDYAFLLGVTGKKVMQSFASKADSSLEWEPVSAGTYVKLKTKGDTFLRANGGQVPPYRNSITHDVPVLASNQHVVLWEVEVVRNRDAPSLPPSRMLSPRQSNATQSKSPPARPPPQPQADTFSDDIPFPPPVKLPRRPLPVPQPQLETSPDEETLTRPQASAYRPRPRTKPNPRRTEDDDDDYSPLSSNQASPAASPPRRRPSPPSEALRNTRIGRRRGSPPREANFDPSPPPRRPRETSYNHEDERRRETSFDESPPPRRRAPLPSREDYGSSASETATPRERHSRRPAPGPARIRDEYESSPSETSSPRRSVDSEDGSRVRTVNRDMRRIFYSVAEDDGEVLAHDDETFGTFMFKGQSLEELTRELKLVTGIREDIILCMRNPLSAKLYKMRLALPQNNAPLSIVIVRSNSQFGRTFSTQPTRQR